MGVSIQFWLLNKEKCTVGVKSQGGRLGHGVDADAAHPKLISTLSGINIECTILVFLVMGMILLIGFQRSMAHWKDCTSHQYHVDLGIRLL